MKPLALVIAEISMTSYKDIKQFWSYFSHIYNVTLFSHNGGLHRRRRISCVLIFNNTVVFTMNLYALELRKMLITLLFEYMQLLDQVFRFSEAISIVANDAVNALSVTVESFQV